MKLKSTKFYFILFSLAFCFGFTPNAYSQSDRIPPENFIADIPSLPELGNFRVTWYFLRPPHLWVQDQVVDLSKIQWPLWEDSVPIVLSPPGGGVKSTLILEDENGNVLSSKPFTKPVSMEKYELTLDKIKNFKVRIEDQKGRFALTSKSYPWVKRKEVFHCNVELQSDELITKNRRVAGCLNTIKNMAAEKDKQWYAIMDWPDQRDAEAKAFVSSWDRDLRSAYRKQLHAYESNRQPKRRFTASVGITRKELAEKIVFNSLALPKAEKVIIPPTREQIVAQAGEHVLSDGSKLEVFSFASDFSENRSKANSVLSPMITVQFVAGAAEAPPTLRATEFREARTGIAGFLRPWRGNLFFTFNRLISNRGETANFGNGPGIDLQYSWKKFDVSPYLRFESGLYHPGSTLLINEVEVGAKKGFGFLPEWLKVGAGYHQFQLAGRNPSSTRLGKIDAIDAGLFASKQFENEFLRFQVKGLVGSSLGMDAQVEYGKLLKDKSEIPYSVSVFAGFTRYAGEATTITRRTETFTEDRFRLGFSFGFTGPDSH